jgi:hypothetical protein
MRILVDKFLLHFGCTNPQAMGRPQGCPGCRRDTLVISTDPITDATIFHCPTCRFHGDAVQFTSILSKQSITDALARFSTGGDLQSLLQKGYTQSQLQEYTNQHHSQGHIRQYAAQLHAQLAARSGIELAQEIPAFRGGGTLTFPADMGLILDKSAPPALVKLEAARFKRNRYFSFTYTYNRHVVGINTRQVHDLNVSEYVAVQQTDLGVFLENTIADDTSVLFVAPDDITAAVLYTRAQSLSTKPLQVIAARQLPLPVTLRNIQEINLLSFRDRPLSLHTALRYLTVPEIIATAKPPECFVTYQATTLERVSATQLETVPETRVRLTTWIAQELVQMYRLHGDADIIGILGRYRMTEDIQNTLHAAFKTIHAPEGLFSVLQQLQRDLTDERRLTNGKRILRTSSGFMGFSGATPIPLSDTAFRVDECICTRNNEILYRVTVFCPKLERGHVTTTLRPADFRSGAALKEAIQLALITTGENIAVTFYTERGYDWDEIRDAFLENNRVTQEIQLLGADDAGYLHLPNCRINVAKYALEEQQPLLTFDKDAVQTYGAIRPVVADNANATIALWTTDTPEHAALAAGLCHIMGQALHGVVARRAGAPHYPQHLMYVDLAPTTWLPSLRQLATIVSGSEFLPHLPHNRPLPFVQERTDLGCLPYICQIPRMTPQRAVNLVQESPVSLLSLVDNDSGEHMSAEDNVWFVALEQMPPRLPGLLPPELILKLRSEFPILLAYFLHNCYRRDTNYWLTATNPIVQVYDWMSELLQIERNTQCGHVANICKKHYTAYDYYTARAFFYELRKMFFSGGAAYPAQVKLRGPTRPTKRFAVWEDTTNNMVHIHKQLINVINQRLGKAAFNPDVLSAEMQEAGYLIGQNEAYWTVTDDVWQTHVANHIHILQLTDTSASVAVG